MFSTVYQKLTDFLYPLIAPKMAEYWIISAPGDKTPQQTFDKLNQETGQRGNAPLSRNFKFNIPELKVGTIDSLLGLSDDLAKLDSHAER